MPGAVPGIRVNNWRCQARPAILLRKRKFSDTSLIVSWCTGVVGCIQTMAKGARRRRVRSPASWICFSKRYAIARAGSRISIPLLKSPCAILSPVPENYLRMQTPAYFVELIEICTNAIITNRNYLGFCVAPWLSRANNPNLRGLRTSRPSWPDHRRARSKVLKASSLCTRKFVREITAFPCSAA